MLALRARCNNSLASYLLTSLFLSPPSHARHYHTSSYRVNKPSPPNNRDYTKSVPRKKAKEEDEDEKSTNKRKHKPPPPPSNPFLRKTPLYTPKRTRHTTFPEPYKHTESGYARRKEQEKRMIRYDLIAKQRRDKEELKRQKNAVFSSETLPAVMTSQQIAGLILSQKKMSRSLAVFKEARKGGLAKNGHVYAALVTKLCDFDQPLYALSIPKESLQEVHSDLPAKAFIKAVGEQRAVELVQLARKMMVKENILPMSSTYVTFAKIFGAAQRSYDTLELVQEMEASNAKLDEHSYQAMCMLFRTMGNYEKVRMALNKMAFGYQVTHMPIVMEKGEGEGARASQEEVEKEAISKEEGATTMNEGPKREESAPSMNDKEHEEVAKGEINNGTNSTNTDPTTTSDNNEGDKRTIAGGAVGPEERATTKVTEGENRREETTVAAEDHTKEEDKEKAEKTNNNHNNNNNNSNNNTQKRRHLPFMLLKTHELDKMIMKNSLKEKQDEVLKVV